MLVKPCEICSAHNGTRRSLLSPEPSSTWDKCPLDTHPHCFLMCPLSIPTFCCSRCCCNWHLCDTATGGIFPDLLGTDGTKTLWRSEKSAASFCHPQNNRRNKIIQRNPEESLEIFPQDNPLSASHTSPENHSSEQTHLPSA